MSRPYKISGVPVLFPGKPYPSQFSMMDRIIKGIERRQHCLLESPTGSGKSLALLCSSLAWLMEEKAKKSEEIQEEIEKATCVCACHAGESSSEAPSKPHPDPVTVPSKESETGTDSGAGKDICFINDDDDDEDAFKEDKVNFNTKLPDKKNPRKHISIEYESEGNKSTHENQGGDCQQCSCSPNSSPVQRKIPKIYFGTRTHKQVAQIVRELRKTEYKDIKMTILGSREHTCIHPVVSKTKSKNDGCQELLNGPGCPLKDKVQRYLSHQVITGQGLPLAWDLEDLVKFSKGKRICAYFLSHGLKDDSDLVICPYNYLVDPIIREAISINLKGNVVILDEAHNIEDSAREAASQTIPQESIAAAIKDMEEFMALHNLAEFSRLVYVMRQLDRFIEENKNSLEQKDFNQAYKIWNGFHIVAQLEAMGLGPKHFPDLKKALAQIKEDAETRKEEAARNGTQVEQLKMVTLNVLEQLFVVMDFLYRQELKYADDYRASLVQSTSYVPRHEDNQWLNSRNRSGGRKMVQVETINLNFWSMNPAVAFSNFADTRSVILTSGTLSPMTSFQSELGLDFKIQLEANHIIKDSQVWVGSLGQGPNGSSLMAVYRNLESFTFQDELGQAVLHVCKTVPHGVLCFLPSYKVLDKLYTRWESTGLLDKLGERKQVFREPRSSSKEAFEEEIVSYYRAVDCTNDPDDATDGAIMFAVCRGKISEGLDFADEYARAVISVGIPYPNFKDIQVELKRKYNDSHRHDRGLLSGSDWYDIQAFRALNQALGRCIRHRNDWGALIIIDERFVKSAPKYSKGLSKWVRNKMYVHENYGRGMNSLKEFITRCKEEEKERKLNVSECQPVTPVAPKAVGLDTSPSNAADSCCQNDVGSKGQDGDCQQVKAETGTPNARHFSIFSMAKPRPNSASKPKSAKFPNLSSIAIPSSKPSPNTTTIAPPTAITSSSSSHHLPMAVVHPSFIIPPKPSAPISNVINQPINTNNAFHHITAAACQQHRREQTSLPQYQQGVNTLSHINKSIPCTNNTNTKPPSSSPLVCQNTNSNTEHDIPGTNSTTTTHHSKQIVIPVHVEKPNHVTLRIITAVAQSGTRMQVFEIDPSLHEVFGGNLNLPVSTTERLVYVVEPPLTPGGNPLARIIRMSKEEKENLAKASENQIQQHKNEIKTAVGRENPTNSTISSGTLSDNLSKEEKEKLTRASENLIQQSKTEKRILEVTENTSSSSNKALSSNLPCQPHAKNTTNGKQLFQAPPPSNSASLHFASEKMGMKSACRKSVAASSTDSSRKDLKETVESNLNTSNVRICNNSNNNGLLQSDTDNNGAVMEGIQNSLEEESNSSCPLFDSPATVSPFPDNRSTSHPQQAVNRNRNAVASHHYNHNQSENKSHSSPIDSTTTGKTSNKNPLLKFLQTSDSVTKDSSSKVDSNSKSIDTSSKLASKTAPEKSVSNSSIRMSTSGSKISPDLFVSSVDSPVAVTENALNVKSSKMRKPLFRVSDKHSTFNTATLDNQSGKGSKADSECHQENAVVESKTNNVRRSASKSNCLESSPLAPGGKEDGRNGEGVGEITLNVKRKCGRKRRSLSLRSRDDDAKKSKCEADDSE